MRSLVSRTVAHDEMKQVASAFASGSLSPQLQAVGVVSVSDELKVVAKTFVVLQQARHEADYNRDTSFTRDQVKKLVQLVSEAFQDWKTVRSQPEARAYLVCLLFGKRLR